jgi:threonine synthase
MALVNLRNRGEKVGFEEAVLRGTAADGGLYFPERLEPLADPASLLKVPFPERSVQVLRALIGPELPVRALEPLVERAFDFPVPVVGVRPRIQALELFHGPTLAFKDFGARFLAQVLARIVRRRKITGRLTVLTATSGDTGAAVAKAFHRVEPIDVVVLYPAGRVSALQERLFATLGDNVRSFAVQGSFDDCQALVKACFVDPALHGRLKLTSANSINIARLYAQACYYFEGVARAGIDSPVIAVPSGNFGNLTAGLIAARLGLPIKALVAATNANATVSEFVAGGEYRPRPAVATLSNAMDVGDPSNWPRILALFGGDPAAVRQSLRAGSLSDPETREVIRELADAGYRVDPHGAVGYRVLERTLQPGESGIFLATAHPAKFKQIMEEILRQPIPLPPALAEALARPLLSEPLPNDLRALKEKLL